MKLHFTRNSDTDDVIEVTLVLSWEEYMFMVDGTKVFRAMLDVDWDIPPGLSIENQLDMIRRFDDMDGDGENYPIDVESFDDYRAGRKELDQ